MAQSGIAIVNLQKQGLKDRKRIKELGDMNGVLENENGVLELEVKKYNEFLLFLSNYLFEKTNNTYTEEKEIKEQIISLLVANTEPIDNVLIVDGYITNVNRVGTLIRPIEIPDDIANGYWKLIDEKYVIDKDRYNQLWSVL